MDWDSLIGGMLGSPLLVLAAGVVGRIWPDTFAAFASWLYGHVDPERLPYGSPMNRHWEQVSDQEELAARFERDMRELRKDTIKNTLIGLICDKDTDHSEAVRYELDKLTALDANCWVIDAARRYLLDRQKEKKT